MSRYRLRVIQPWTTRCLFFFFNDTATTEIYTLSLHDALPISPGRRPPAGGALHAQGPRRKHEDRLAPHGQGRARRRSEEHTSELQSPCNLVCRLLLEKKNTLDSTSRVLSATVSFGIHLLHN